MKGLFVTTALLEGATGFGLVVAPTPLVALLIGATLDAPGGTVIARITAAALLSLGLACWLARNETRGAATKALLAALLLYNVATAAILIYAGLGLNLSAMGLWPAAGVHVGMALWCANLLRISASSRTRYS